MTLSAEDPQPRAPRAPGRPGPSIRGAAACSAWLLAAVGAGFVLTTWVTGSLPDPAWRWAIAGAVAASSFVIWRRSTPAVFGSVLALATLRLITLRLPDDGPPTIGALVVNAVIGVALCLLVLVGFRYRNGRLGQRDIVDVVGVVIGSGVVAWLLVGRPLLDAGASTGSVVLTTAYLPITSLLVVFTVDVAFSGLSRNRTAWFGTGAAVAHLAATWAWSLHAVEVLPEWARDMGYAANAAAVCFLAAALAHPDAVGTLAPVGRTREGSDSITRLTMLGLNVLLPVSLVAAIAPSSATDVVVRLLGIGLLVVAVVVRLVIATQQNREARDTLLRQVTRDDLTKLPNRSRFIDDVAAILEATWHEPERAAVIQLNLDRFKNINDNFGHYAANEVLIVLADRLRDVADEVGASVARVGGDDFALVHGGTRSVDEALECARLVGERLANPVTVAETSVFVTASIGVAIAPRHRTVAAEELMRQADIAAHQAKQNGRNRVEVFDESMQARLTRRMDVEHALHGAIGRREMRLYHQPIVDIVSGRISGFEALMRWQRQDGTVVSPADFIPIAEDTGIICELGAWAIGDALGQLRRWIDEGVVGPATTMSVNVSPRQVTDPTFAETVRAAIADAGVPPHLLWLEITESMMLDEPERVAATLDEIRSLGVRIALDDFGTGFSSLSLLQQFPIQRIKIDRAFVQGIGDQANDRSLVRTIIAMAQSMALDLVAEGVETVDQLQALRELGCDKAQGFLISRPVPADAMRSTMVALDELASLSMFSGRASDVAVETSSPTPSPAVGRPLAAAGPMSPLASRPLGGPRL